MSTVGQHTDNSSSNGVESLGDNVSVTTLPPLSETNATPEVREIITLLEYAEYNSEVSIEIKANELLTVPNHEIIRHLHTVNTGQYKDLYVRAISALRLGVKASNIIAWLDNQKAEVLGHEKIEIIDKREIDISSRKYVTLAIGSKLNDSTGVKFDREQTLFADFYNADIQGSIHQTIDKLTNSPERFKKICVTQLPGFTFSDPQKTVILFNKIFNLLCSGAFLTIFFGVVESGQSYSNKDFVHHVLIPSGFQVSDAVNASPDMAGTSSNDIQYSNQLEKIWRDQKALSQPFKDQCDGVTLIVKKSRHRLPVVDTDFLSRRL